MKKKLLLILGLFVLTISSALAYRSTVDYGVADDTAIVITWKSTHSGRWFASGPSQKTFLSDESEKKAMNYVYDEEKYEPIYIGTIGKYRVYSLGYTLHSYDRNARKDIK